MKKIPHLIVVIIFLNSSLRAQVHWSWGKTRSGVFEDYALVNDSKGNIYLGGMKSDGNSNNEVYTICKYDSSGSLIWEITEAPSPGIRGAVVTDLAVSNEDGVLYAIGVYDDNILSAGTDTVTDTTRCSMYFLLKCSLVDGSVMFLKNIAPAQPLVSGSGRSSVGKIALDGLGDIYVAGSFFPRTITIGGTTLVNADTSETSSDIFVAKYLSGGTSLWVKSFGGIGSEFSDVDRPLAFTVSHAGNIYLSGQYLSSALTLGAHTLYDSSATMENSYFLKMNSDGSIAWSKGYDHYVKFYDIKLDVQENAFLAGALDSIKTETLDTTSITSSSFGNALCARFDSSGLARWIQVSSHGFGSAGYDLNLDECGNLWMTGIQANLLGPVDSLIFADSLIIEPNGFPWGFTFLVEMDTAGKIEHTGHISTGNVALPAFGCKLITDGNGSLVVSGDYVSSRIVFGMDTLSNTSGYPQVVYVGRGNYGACSLGLPLRMEVLSPTINIAPNPAKGNVTISFSSDVPTGTSLEILDLLGRRVDIEYLDKPTTELSLSRFAQGLYLFRFSSFREIFETRKVLIEK